MLYVWNYKRKKTEVKRKIDLTAKITAGINVLVGLTISFSQRSMLMRWVMAILMVGLLTLDANAFGRRHRRHHRESSGCSSSIMITQPQVPIPVRTYEGQPEEMTAPPRTLNESFGPTTVDRSTQPRKGEIILIFRDGHFIETVYR